VRVRKVRSLAAWVRLIRNGLDPRSAIGLRRGRRGEIRFRGRSVGGPDPGRLAWMATHIWGGEYDLPGFVPRKGDRVADIGANIGIFSLLAADRGATVTAIEPHAGNFTWLERNTAGWAIECRRAAVLGRVPPGGEVTLIEGPGHTAHHVAGTHAGEPDGETAPVPAVSFAELVAEGYDLVKLDVEGAEFGIVADTPLEILAQLRRLVAEVHHVAGDPELLCDRLSEAGLAVTLSGDGEDPDHSLLTARG
jgi:FkbM family methyltransferase